MKQKSNSKIIILLLVLLFACGIVMLISYISQKNASNTEMNALSLEEITSEFASAYFNKDIDTIKSFLTDSYDEDITVYTEASIPNDYLINGLDNIGDIKVGETCEVWVEFTPDSGEFAGYYVNLTLNMIQEKDGWKVASYGLEL